jgi:predicted small lipoprotein YifL
VRRALLLSGVLLLAGCGKQGVLTPVAPNTPPQQPADTVRPLTADEMLKLPPQAIPGRVDDPLSRSRDRPDDRFNLPPPRRNP